MAMTEQKEEIGRKVKKEKGNQKDKWQIGCKKGVEHKFVNLSSSKNLLST